MNVLFLSVSTGAGHMKAAEALKVAVECKYPSSKNLIIDTLRYINPVVDKLVVGGYLSAVRGNPRIYEKIYEMSEQNNHIYYFSKALNYMFSYKIKSLIRESNPSVIVCTHPFSLQMLSILKKKNIIDIPVAAVLTDYVTHSFWVHECIDAYIVAHDIMKHEMVNRGIPEKNVFVYGIPVSSHFLKEKCRRTLLNELGLDDKITVLVMGGSLGLGEIESAFDILLTVERDIQIIILTGHNIRIKNRLEQKAKKSQKKVKILSFTNRVSDFMDISDLLITKPGGMTISEALVKELPTIVVSPIPGQEEGNARFLSRQGAAIKIDSMENLGSILYQLLDNKSEIQQLKDASRLLARPNASQDILQLLEQMTNKKNCWSS